MLEEAEMLRSTFGIPADHEPIGAVAIGRNNEVDRPNLASERRPLAEMAHYGQWRRLPDQRPFHDDR